jgi:hypothetical protein
MGFDVRFRVSFVGAQGVRSLRTSAAGSPQYKAKPCVRRRMIRDVVFIALIIRSLYWWMLSSAKSSGSWPSICRLHASMIRGISGLVPHIILVGNVVGIRM